MKKFRFKYSPVIWILLALVIALLIGGIIWNAFNLVQYLWAGTFKIVIYSLIIALTAFLLLFALSMLFYGRYVVKSGFIFTYFGLIKSKVEIKNVVQVTHFKKSDKLVVYFSDQKFTVIVIDPKYYDDFVHAVREFNREIIFHSQTEEPNLKA